MNATSLVFISQDREEIYVTIAEYMTKYMGYRKKQIVFEDAEFLRMNTCGPFRTRDSQNMALMR